MNGFIGHKDSKAKKNKRMGSGKYTTTRKDIKNFTKQIETEEFVDKKFEKAFSKFKASAYQSGNGELGKG